MWKIVGGPDEYFKSPEVSDIDIGWRYSLERDGEHRTLRVEVAGGRSSSPSLPEECQFAIRARGKSAISRVLDREVPPERIRITAVGLIES